MHFRMIDLEVNEQKRCKQSPYSTEDDNYSARNETDDCNSLRQGQCATSNDFSDHDISSRLPGQSSIPDSMAFVIAEDFTLIVTEVRSIDNRLWVFGSSHYGRLKEDDVQKWARKEQSIREGGLEEQ